VEPLDRTATRALRLMLDLQPLTEAKVGFAWKIAAGAALGRATTVSWRGDGRLLVRARSHAWRDEVRRARPIILARLRELLGPDAVNAIAVSEEPLGG
jgi:hypothetical protein